MNKIHIVYICARFHPFKGGAEENTYQLAKRMVEAGHQVAVLTTDASPDGTPLPKYEVYDGINIIRVHRWNQQLNLGFYPTLVSELLKIKVDVIHYENGPGFIWQEWCLILKRIFSPRTKFIATPHGRFLATAHHTGLKKLIYPVAKFIGNMYFRLIWSWLFHRVIEVNKQQHNWMHSDYWISPRKVVYVPNGVPDDLVHRKPDTESRVPSTEYQGKRYETTTDSRPLTADSLQPTTYNQTTNTEYRTPITITTLGRMEKYKGAHLVIAALAKLKSEGVDNFRYIILGKPDAQHTPELVTQIKSLDLESEVQLVPSPSRQERDRIIGTESQISVLFSEWEATGIVLLEAMAMGNAIITSDTNEAAYEIVADGVNGYVVKYPDVNALAAALKKIIKDENLRAAMIHAGYQKVESYTWETIFPVYLDVVAGLLNT